MLTIITAICAEIPNFENCMALILLKKCSFEMVAVFLSDYQIWLREARSGLTK